MSRSTNEHARGGSAARIRPAGVSQRDFTIVAVALTVAVVLCCALAAIWLGWLALIVAGAAALVGVAGVLVAWHYAEPD